MKFSAAFLALATSALGYEIEVRGGHEGGDATTLTTYTTVTTCPVTSTYTKEGTTYCETLLTTSTIVVTECHGCGGGVTTVPGPDVTRTALETDYTTITSLCPITETKTVGGSVITVTYTTTEYIKKNGYTTIYETQRLPDATHTAVETDFETITSLCPVTVVTTIAGKETTVTYTTTEYIKKNAYTTIYETQRLPDATRTALETDYITRTSLCPVTETVVVSGKEVTRTFTSTQIIKENAYTTIYETKQLPDVTETAVEIAKETITSLCPVTEIKTINGERKTLTYTSTSIYVTQVKTVIEQTQYNPGHTETAVEIAKETLTSLCPVTQVKTVNGDVVTKIFTSTQIIVQEVPTTIEAIETIYRTVEGQEVETQYSKVYVTIGGGTVVQTVQPPPTHVVVPQTSVVQAPPVTVTNELPPAATTAPVEVPPNAAQGKQAPAVAFVVGIVGLLAML